MNLVAGRGKVSTRTATDATKASSVRRVDRGPLHCRSSLQVLFDLCCVFAIETFRLFVELGVPLVDVVDV